MRMNSGIGNLIERKFIDIIIVNIFSSVMIYATIHNPIMIIILHSSIRDMDIIIMDDII